MLCNKTFDYLAILSIEIQIFMSKNNFMFILVIHGLEMVYYAFARKTGLGHFLMAALQRLVEQFL